MDIATGGFHPNDVTRAVMMLQSATFGTEGDMCSLWMLPQIIEFWEDMLYDNRVPRKEWIDWLEPRAETVFREMNRADAEDDSSMISEEKLAEVEWRMVAVWIDFLIRLKQDDKEEYGRIYGDIDKGIKPKPL